MKNKIYSILSDGEDGIEEWRELTLYDITTDYLISSYGRVANPTHEVDIETI